MERVLLLVDDEPNILSALGRVLARDRYRVIKAQGGEEGLRLLGEHPVGVVLSDQQMPGMNGVELLDHVRARYPHIARLMLTGHGDLRVATEAVNRGAIFKFMAKPWDDEALRADIREAFEHHELLVEKERLKEELFKSNEELVSYCRHLREQISERAAELIELTQHDALTGFPNRLLFTDRLGQAIAAAQTGDKAPAVVMIGLDRFKMINETYGHAAGDQLIIAVAQRLRACIPRADTVARFSGVEFAIVLGVSTAREVLGVVNKLHDAFARPFLCGDHEVFVSVSSGIGIYPLDGEAPEALIKSASAAVYHAKRQGGSNFQFYAKEFNARIAERVALENDLHRALKRNEFRLFYQPQIDVLSGRIAGVEALLRWQHPERGLVGPDAFIPILEETGQIEPVGEWVLRTALGQVRAWQEMGLSVGRMAVNLSAKQFEGERLPRAIKRIVARSGIDPRTTALEFEVTESLVIHNVEQVIALLHDLKAMGIRIAIDDFGTGYASLSYLTRFPIHALKIDRSFISRIGTTEADTAVVAAIIAMAHSLKLQVIAEGVETEAQLDFLREQGCDELQGFLFSRPVPAEEITRLLHEQGAD